MAITNIHPIKATISYAIDYIIDPQKTDEKTLVTGVNCLAETAAKEFEFTRKLAEMNRTKGNKGKNLGWHLIQSFAPNEIKHVKKAHEIGIELAKKTFGDKYEFVISTHIDKGHVHNHIIFNSVDTIDNKYYVSNYKTLYDIRNKSDKLCKENGLSVIKNAKRTFAKKDFNHKQGEKHNFTSTNKMILYDVRLSINEANTIEDFFKNLDKKGYSIKQTKKNITLQHKTMDRGRRLSTLGKTVNEDFSLESIRKKIEKGFEYTKEEIGDVVTLEEASGDDITKDEQGKIENIESKELQKISFPDELKSSFYTLSYKDKKQKIDQLVTTINFISEHEISNRNEIEQHIENLSNNEISTRSILQILEDKIDKLSAGFVLAKKYNEIKTKIDKVKKNPKSSNTKKDELAANTKVLKKVKNDLKEQGFRTLSEALNAEKDIRELKYARINVVNNYQAIRKEKQDFLNLKYNINEIDYYNQRYTIDKNSTKEKQKDVSL